MKPFLLAFMKREIDIVALRQRLTYEPDTGVFFWKESKCPRVKPGDVAGHKRDDGYIIIFVEKKPWYAHRLAWVFMHGRLPTLLDHINQKRDDNRISNLRESNKSENAWNSKQFKTNKSGHKGVLWCAPMKKWRMSALRRGVLHRTYHHSKEEAIQAYKALEMIYG